MNSGHKLKCKGKKSNTDLVTIGTQIVKRGQKEEGIFSSFGGGGGVLSLIFKQGQ